MAFQPTKVGEWKIATVSISLKNKMNQIGLWSPAKDKNEVAIDYFELQAQ